MRQSDPTKESGTTTIRVGPSPFVFCFDTRATGGSKQIEVRHP